MTQASRKGSVGKTVSRSTKHEEFSELEEEYQFDQQPHRTSVYRPDPPKYKSA
jgi:hypothetical protein